MSTLRKHKTSRFTTVSNSALEDERLSFKAKGLLVYLLSKPDGWQVKYRHLMGVGTDGEVAVKSALNELQRFGYLRREKTRRPDGTFEHTSHLFEAPQNADASGSADVTRNGFSSPGESSPGEPPHIVSTEGASTEKQTPKPPRSEAKKDDRERREFEQFWDGYPRKIAKAAARKAFVAVRRRGIELDALLAGLDGWVEHWESEQTPAKFIPHASTWLNQERFLELPDGHDQSPYESEQTVF